MGAKPDTADDLRKLEALCAHDALSEREREAFPDMAQRVRRGSPLTEPQRDWVRKSYERYELDAGDALNLVSSGLVPRGREVRLPFEDMPRPLRPPARKKADE